jgi:hypothetical protein
MTICPSCDGKKPDKKYLCGTCWFQLPGDTRSRLLMRDRFALKRLQELYDQIGDDVPLSEIEVTL